MPAAKSQPTVTTDGIHIEPASRRRVCGGCKIDFPIESFSWNACATNGRTYRCSRCKSCKAKAMKDWAAKVGKSRRKQSHLLKTYGLSVEKFDEMTKSQGGLCAICNLPSEVYDRRLRVVRSLMIDHCHKTGKARSLLCNHCNTGIGCFKDNPLLLSKAAEYLTGHNPDTH